MAFATPFGQVTVSNGTGYKEFKEKEKRNKVSLSTEIVDENGASSNYAIDSEYDEDGNLTGFDYEVGNHSKKNS